MNTDTPETDAHLLGGSYSFDASFARKLERQRNKAIGACIALRQMVRELLDALELSQLASVVNPETKEEAESSLRAGTIIDAAITKANQLLP